MVYLYLASFLHFIIAPLPSLDAYFKFDSPFFKNEFIESIWTCYGRSTTDFFSLHRRFRVNPYFMIQLFHEVSKKIWRPFEYIHETLMPFQGHFKFKHVIKGERTGLKFYEMCDSKGFVYRLWPSLQVTPQIHILVWDMVSFLPEITSPRHGYRICLDSDLGHYKTAALLNA
ncbi:hypothetical protein C9374_003429 [Naegleria lovaniensis]|uniref:Uncharacterized protein n=1 Tax=Naegleria lovaniensis TaxID=51637 RepID=A0AA88KL98_NAELO|nr:uncharacterized protein C9374_003429 [Naegleria lovaniensis]KAG2385614.1 hypothetical protein C9374_003429 [Naegleria lovaniensis]